MRVQLSATLTFLSLTLNTVSSVGLFVLEGSPVTLTTTQHDKREAIRNIKWVINQTVLVVYYIPKQKEVEVEDLFKGRVEFNRTDFSLMLKNPQRSDSGLYTAVVDIRRKAPETTASYELSVLAPVVAPTLTVVSYWSSRDSCNMNITCKGLNVSLISICNGTFCSQAGGDRFLSISYKDTTVSCNHSNPVSWKQDTIALEPLCPLYRRNPDNGDQEGSWLLIGTGIGLSVIVIVIVIVIGFVIVYLRKKHKEGGAHIGPNTQSNAAPAPAPTVYDDVQFTRHSDSSPTEPAPVMPSSSETQYAVVKNKY